MGNMKFVAQIVKSKMVPFKIAITISQQLLQEGEEESLEALCVLWTDVRL
jgi:hypothetical protein